MSKKISILLVILGMAVVSCKVQFKMNGASIDYTKIQTMTIVDFPNRALLVYAPLEQRFNEGLKDIFTRQTRLNFVPRNGDLQLEGEITGYDITPMSIGSDAYSQTTKLTVTVKVRYTNNIDHTQDFETSISAHQTFPSSLMITQVQDQLLADIIKEITETIYNRSVANW